MRLWLKDSERRPDPVPVVTDDRKAFGIGIVAWLVALVLLLVLTDTVTEPDRAWWVWTCVAGVVIGLGGMAHANWHRRH